jgi:hypothetical protein
LLEISISKVYTKAGVSKLGGPLAQPICQQMGFGGIHLHQGLVSGTFTATVNTSANSNCYYSSWLSTFKYKYIVYFT